MTQATSTAPQRLTDGTIQVMTIDEFIACKALNQSAQVGKYYIRGEVSQASIDKKINDQGLIQTIDGTRYFLIEEEVVIWVNPNDETDRIVIDGNTRRAAAVYVKNNTEYSDVVFMDVRYKLYTGELNVHDLYKFQEVENNATEGHTYLQRANAAFILWQEIYDQTISEKYAEKPWATADSTDKIWAGADKAARGKASKITQAELDISHTTISQYKKILKLPDYIIEHIDNNAIDPIGLTHIVAACNDEKKLKDKYTVEAIYAELRSELKPGQLRVSQNACKSKIDQLVKEINPPAASPSITNETSPDEVNSDDDEVKTKNLITGDDAKLYIDKATASLNEVTPTFVDDERITDQISTIYVRCVELLNSTKNSVSNARKRELLPVLRDLMLEFMDSSTLSEELEADELSRFAHKCGSLTSNIAKAENLINAAENTTTQEISTVEEKPLEAPLVAETSELVAELTQI